MSSGANRRLRKVVDFSEPGIIFLCTLAEEQDVKGAQDCSDQSRRNTRFQLSHVLALYGLAAQIPDAVDRRNKGSSKYLYLQS
jgi:hypothetical protein